MDALRGSGVLLRLTAGTSMEPQVHAHDCGCDSFIATLCLRKSCNLMFLFGLLEFIFTFIVCFNVQAACNRGKMWYKTVIAGILLFPISPASGYFIY